MTNMELAMRYLATADRDATDLEQSGTAAAQVHALLAIAHLLMFQTRHRD